MPFEPGTVVGRYEIESLIAVGGMGEVYRARDHELETNRASCCGRLRLHRVEKSSPQPTGTSSA